MTTSITIRLFDLNGALVAEMPVDIFTGPEPQALTFHQRVFVRRRNTWNFDEHYAWNFKPADKQDAQRLN